MSTPVVLPPQVRAVVDGVVARTRLSRSERDLVRRELEDHFLDALDAGCDPSVAVARFGDPLLAAELIGRARRRNRPPVTRIVRATALPGFCVALLLFAPYGYSAWRLGAAPARQVVPSFDRALDDVPERASAVHASLDSARFADVGQRIERALVEVAHLRAMATLVPELESAQLHARLVETYARTVAELEPGVRAQLRSGLEGDFAPRRDVVEAALGDVLDRVYPPDPDGHPTRDGLRVVRRLKGGDATWRADLLEPAYFLLAAPRAEAEALARDLVDVTWDRTRDGDPVSLRHALVEHTSAERVFAVALVMSRVASALEAAQQAQRTLEALGR